MQKAGLIFLRSVIWKLPDGPEQAGCKCAAASVQDEGSERATPASSRANPKAKAKAPSSDRAVNLVVPAVVVSSMREYSYQCNLPQKCTAATCIFKRVPALFETLCLIFF